jgi:hypothetical protein
MEFVNPEARNWVPFAIPHPTDITDMEYSGAQLLIFSI